MSATNAAEPSLLAREVDIALERIAAARTEIGAVIFGQERVIDLTLTVLLAGGHGLLIGVPGLAKTKLVETLGIVVGLDALRVQFTPDLMPSDILGSEVMEEGLDGRRAFRFIRGRFAQLLMADEINRASPGRSPPSCRRCRNITSRSPACATICRRRFMFWRRRTRSNRRAPIRCRRPSWTGFSCRSTSAIRDRAAERRILIETTGEREARPQPS